MSDNLVSDRPPFTSLSSIFLVIFLGWVIVGPILGIVVGSLFYEGDFMSAMLSREFSPGLRYPILISQGIAAGTGLVLLPWAYLRFIEHRTLTPFFHTEQWPIVAILVLIGVISLNLAISPIVEWNASIEFPEWMSGFGNWAKETEQAAAEIIKSITKDLTPASFALTFLVVAIIAAVGEELVFRGLIQTELMRVVRNHHVAIWIASVLFSAIHLQFMGFVPRMLLGAVFGYLYFWSGNLWVPMLGHFFNNGIQLVGLYLFQKGIINIDLETTEAAPWPMVISAIVVIFPLMIYLKKYFSTRTTTPRDIA